MRDIATGDLKVWGAGWAIETISLEDGNLRVSTKLPPDGSQEAANEFHNAHSGNILTLVSPGNPALHHHFGFGAGPHIRSFLIFDFPPSLRKYPFVHLSDTAVNQSL
jgi:hypothetical protein